MIRKNSISRRFFLGTSASLAGAVAFGGVGRAFASESLNYITSFGYLVDFAPDLNMHSGGHLKDQGFESEFIAGRGSSNAIQALVADQAKFTRLGAMEILRAMSAGEVELVSVASPFQSSSFSLVHAGDTKLASMKELEGKTVGIMSVGGLSENFLDLMLTADGVPLDSVKREVVGNNPGNYELIKLGRIDAFMSSLGTNVALSRDGVEFQEISTDEYAPMPGQCYVTLRSTVEEEPELVQRFVNAANASVREFLTGDLGEIYDRLKADFDIGGDRDQVIQAMEGFRGLVVSEGEENILRNMPELWENAKKNLEASGMASIDDVTKAYTNKFVDNL